MGKFAALYAVLIRDGVATVDQFHCPQPAPPDLIALAHDPAYVQAYLTGTLDARAMRRIGFPWSAALARRTCIALGSSFLAAELALQHGLACSTAGGTHHAFYDFGSGFCIFNDLAVTARAMVQQGRARRVLIVDLDVHQGDGTAAILVGDQEIFTFSMHCGANFPFHKQTSDLDVDLPVGMKTTPTWRRWRCGCPTCSASTVLTWCSTTQAWTRIATTCWASWRSATPASSIATAM